MLECIFLVDYICKDNQYHWPWCKLVLKQKIMINEDKWEIWKKMIFLINDQFVFLFDPPYEKDQKVEKCLTFNFDECSIFLLILPVLLKEYNLFSPNNESYLEQ